MMLFLSFNIFNRLFYDGYIYAESPISFLPSKILFNGEGFMNPF
jgi:hypothetical protein